MLIEAGALTEGSSLYDASNIILLQHLISGLRAHVLFQKNVHYIVKNDEVVIVDEFTGRTMEGRRWSEGLHQAIEAKENVSIKQENQTLASITYQNYFRLYDKLAGMTGTAETEATELQDIYGLEVVVVPPNTKSAREGPVRFDLWNHGRKARCSLKRHCRLSKKKCSQFLLEPAVLKAQRAFQPFLRKIKLNMRC